MLTLIFIQAVEDDVIPLQFPVLNTKASEVRVKAGQLIQIPIRDGVNVDEAIWGPDAAEFRPERWLEEDRLPEAVRSMYMQGHVLTFGDGCVFSQLFMHLPFISRHSADPKSVWAAFLASFLQ